MTTSKKSPEFPGIISTRYGTVNPEIRITREVVRRILLIFFLVTSLPGFSRDPGFSAFLNPGTNLNEPARHKRADRLFNGKDLTGWEYRTKVQEVVSVDSFDGETMSKDGRYMAKDGMLTINPWDETKGPHWINLWHSKEFTGDFSLSLEFRASPNADSGIFLRGKQLQCRDYLVAGPYKELKNYKPQDWNKIEVVVKNNIARCTCNGEVLEEGLRIPEKGSIGLEADRGRMDYKNIRLKFL